MPRPDWRVYAGAIPDRADALKFNIAKCCEASRRRAEPASLEEWKSRLPALRDQLAEALGLLPMPKRTPLKARVVGRAERADYFIENVVFESRPRFYVTANLYLPKKADFPAPGVVVAMGHAMKEGKNSTLYQAGQVALVRQGFVVLGFDPIGQGERVRPGMAHNLGYGSLLVGQTNEGMIVWDAIRAVDYLCTRKEVDATRLGVTGNSGGGEATFYTMPLDERLKAGASNCFVCSYEEWIRHGGNHCVCNHLPGMARRLEEFEIVGLNAPRAFLFCNGAQDTIFPLKGVKDTAQRAGRVYELLGIPDRVKQVDFPLPHGWAQPLREASVGWLAHYLLGNGEGGPIPENPFEPEAWDAKDLLCFKDGRFPQDAETVVTLNRALAERLTRGYAALPRTRKTWTQRAEQLRGQLWVTFGGKPAPFAPRLEEVSSQTWNGNSVQKARIWTEPGMEVPALLVRSQTAAPSGKVVVFLDEKDKSTLADSAVVTNLLQAGTLVCAVDPRGLGEVHCHDNHLASDAIHLGRPLFAQQLWDVMQTAKRVAKLDGITEVACYGRGAAGLLALFAGALSDDVARVAADGCLASYRYALEDSQPQPLWVFAPNLLKVADVPQIAALCAPKSTLVCNAVGFGGKALSRRAAAEQMAFAKVIFELHDAGSNLRIATAGAAGEAILALPDCQPN
jgi:cephalosporin-C deacetylase-like acetyl esterase